MSRWKGRACFLDLVGRGFGRGAPMSAQDKNVTRRAKQVSDVSPLAGLTALQSLYLDGTQVSDVSPLAHIRDLCIIGVRNS